MLLFFFGMEKLALCLCTLEVYNLFVNFAGAHSKDFALNLREDFEFELLSSV